MTTKTKRVLVLAGMKTVYDLILRQKGWSPRDAVYVTRQEQMCGISPENAKIVWGHRWWTQRDAEHIEERAKVLIALGAEEEYVET